ncbi:hypothetical protein OH768_34600 [Streptomyces sp. NBC_01622]|uniref:hypothetical protein n=1 Tax=Streptomyces sp. NBC_01622 TaxID=2975903 RepID=UPI003867E8F1|nr:hypothetical protein OH768_34600 [Streptomyces sp. NBC_01622]
MIRSITSLARCAERLSAHEEHARAVLEAGRARDTRRHLVQELGVEPGSILRKTTHQEVLSDPATGLTVRQDPSDRCPAS